MAVQEPVGIVGSGDIGQALARNAIRAGFPVVVYDVDETAASRTVGAGGLAADSLAGIAAAARTIQIAVMDDAQVEDVVGALLPVARSGTVVLVHSTIHPRTVETLAAAAVVRGVHLLDAPVTDPFGSQGILARTANFLVGGPADLVARVRPLLDASAARVFHLGPVGAGATAKLVRNYVMYVTLLAAHEGRALADACGLDRTTLRDVLRASGASSQAMDHVLERTIYDDEYRRRLPTLIGIFEKDLRLGLALGRAHALPLPAGELMLATVRALLSPPDS
jgi:3-hydroxyisobutyrate dehydrogenase-like beta-hydroxyacid dehydrogenase